MKIKALRKVLPFLAVPLTVVWFQNCSRNLHVEAGEFASTFKDAEDCIKGTADACVFDKSPVSQMGRSVSAEDVGGFQVVPVSLSDRDASGYLQNNDFAVSTIKTSRWPASANFRQYYSSSNSALEQVMAYVAVRKARDWMKTLGVFPAANLGLKIYADSSFNGFIPATNEIHLERNGVNLSAALDSSVAISLYAQANIKIASNGASHDATKLATHTVACNTTNGYKASSACCDSRLGCGAAIVSGAADYMIAAIYGDLRAVVGDGLKNDPRGLTVCGLARNAAKNAALTTTIVESACLQRGSPENATALGIVYAAAWWEARRQATDKAAFDRFFLRHLAKIDGSYNFNDIADQLSSLATNSTETQFASWVKGSITARNP